MVSMRSEQMELTYDSGPVRDVTWANVEWRGKRKGLLRKKVFELMSDPDDMLSLKKTSINAADIDTIKDPDLRYALRFADAAEAIGWFATSRFSSSAHGVTIQATDEGFDSKLINADYTGTGYGTEDTFMNNLRRQAPVPEVSGWASVHVVNDESSMGTVYWVRKDEPGHQVQ